MYFIILKRKDRNQDNVFVNKDISSLKIIIIYLLKSTIINTPHEYLNSKV